MAIKGVYTRISYGDKPTFAESTTWTPFAKITEFGGVKVDADDIDVSTMESPGADEGKPFKEFEPGWADGGEVPVTIQFEKTKTAEVYGLFRVPKGYRVTLSDGSMWEVDGYVKSFGVEVDRAGIVTVPVTIKVSGEPEYTPAPDAP